jgi:hypothetical protein
MFSMSSFSQLPALDPSCRGTFHPKKHEIAKSRRLCRKATPVTDLSSDPTALK